MKTDLKIDLKVYVNQDGTRLKRGQLDILKPIFKLSNLVYRLNLVCPFSAENTIQVIFEKADNTITPYYNMYLSGTEKVGNEFWNVYTMEIYSEVTEVSSKESNYNKLGFNFCVKTLNDEEFTLNTEPYYVTCNYSITGEQIQYNPIQGSELISLLNNRLEYENQTKIYKVNSLPPEEDVRLVGNTYLITGEFEELSQFQGVESLDSNKVYKYVGESTDVFEKNKFYVPDIVNNSLKETIDVEKNKGNIYRLTSNGYEVLSYGKEIVALDEELKNFINESKPNLKIFSLDGETISDELLTNLENLLYRSCILTEMGSVGNPTICYFKEGTEKSFVYVGLITDSEKGLKRLTITIDVETKLVKYEVDNKLSSIEDDISVLKENVQKIIGGSAAVQAGGWVKIDGTLKPQEVNALYSTKGTGLYTITSEEYGKETIFIDTSKGMFKRQTGMYDYTYNFDTGNWEILASGTGGGGGTSGAVILTNKTPLEATAAVGGEYKIQYEYTSTQDTKGTAQYYIDGTLRRTQAINTGTNEFDVSEYIIAGERVVKVEVSDRYGNSNSLTFIITGIELKLESKFSDSRAYSGVIDFRYTPYGTVAKNVKLYIDDKLYKEEVVYVTGEEQAINVSGLTHDVHKFRLEMNAIIGGTTIESNDLNYSVIYVVEGNNQILISSKFDKKTATQGELLNVDYLVYNPLSEYTNIDLSINGEVVNELSVGRSRQYWNLTNYPVGDLRLEIIANAEEENAQTKTFNLSVTSAEINVNPVTTNLQLYLSAQNRSNSEPITERVKWQYNDVTATLNNFNWSTNGWVTDKKGNNLLRLNGKANVYIPFNIFGTDFLSLGKTIEFDFATTDIYDITKLLVSCYANDKGFQITSNDAILKSEQTEVSTKFKEDERVRVSFVIQSTASTRLVKTFINGECCGLAQYPDSDEFKQANPVGITINNLEGSIDIYSIRIYNQDLNDRQMLNNYMSDLSFNEKIAAYTRNNILDDYGQVAYSKVKPLIPILIITGNLPAAKGDKKIVKALYENPFDSSKNFSYDGVEIDIQGTSSQFYPRKNYKLKFPTAFSFKNNAVEEKTYTFKADYMESSHSHNTGNAKFINSISPQFPTQASNSNVRNTIDGFPIVIFVRSSDSADLEYYGVFNFNNDKGNKDTLGLTTPYAESWEFKNNISARCLFRSDDLSEKVEDDFEARYPKDYKDYTKLQRVLSWVVSTEGNVEKFKEEFETYFNKEFCLFYYVMMEVMLAVDSRAKNMFLDTTDGVIWYPRWYDIDTTYGLNNEGVNQFGYGLEQHDFIGDVAVFNGENSLLWNNFEEAFGDEIKQYYYDLRSNGKLSYEAIYNVIYGEQISKISQAMYNTDGNFKYIGPVIEDNDTTYLYVEQGSRLNHFQWWLSNRIKYLDSKYEYAEFKDDFISMRTYTPDDYVVAPTNYFELKPFSDMYLQVLFGSSTIRERAIANVSERVSAPSGLKFNNTETIIYGASRILDVGDLSTKYARTMDFSKALKLKRLQIGNETIGYQNTNLNELTIGNNTMLEYLDIRNCPNLTQSIDLTGCLNIKEVYASGTNIAAVNLASGGNLTTLQLPASVSNLVLVNQPLLTNFSMPSYSNVKSLRLENVAVESLPIVRQATELERVRLIDINWVLTNEEQIILNNLLDVRGFNADGSSTEKAVLTGRIHIQGLVGDRSLKAWNKYFNNQETIEPVNPNVVITADEIGLTHLVRFLDYKGDVIEEKIVGHNTFTTYTGATPTKPTNETLKEKYTFSNWNPSLLTAITQDTDFIPQFTITKYYQYIFVNGNGNEIYRGYADNGTLVTYTNPLVPYKAENTELQERYEFNGTWSPSLNTPISADTIYTPNFTITKYWRYTFVNGDNSIIYSGFADNGTTVTYNSDVVPSRAENVEEQIEYVFNGNWTPSLDRNIEANTTYEPDFVRKQYYYVEFRNYDNTLLQRTKVYKGESVEYTGVEPTRPDENGISYTFEGWDTNLTNIQSNLIVTAIYKSGTPLSITLDLTNPDELQPTLEFMIPETLDSDNRREYPYWTFEVNWGDGNVETINQERVYTKRYTKSTPYNSIGKYKITIKINDNGKQLVKDLYGDNASSSFNEFGEYNNKGFIGIYKENYTKYITDYFMPEGYFYHLDINESFSGSKITSLKIPEGIITLEANGTYPEKFQNIKEVYFPKSLKKYSDSYFFYEKQNKNEITNFYYNGSLQDYLNIQVYNNGVFRLTNVDFYLKENGNYVLKKDIVIDDTITTIASKPLYRKNLSYFSGDIYYKNFDLNVEQLFSNIQGNLYVDFSLNNFFSVFEKIGNSIGTKKYFLKVNNEYKNVTEITNINIPNNINNIEPNSFYQWGLTSVEIPDSVTNIGSSAFQYCENLTSVIIPNSVTSIGDSAFSGCNSLINLVIPNSVTNIGKNSLSIGLSSNTNKATIIFESTTPPSITTNTFSEYSLNRILVPKGCAEAYKTATNWTNFANYIYEIEM